MRPLLALSLLTYVLLGYQSAADATMVKCKGDRGSVVYQDEPCKPGMELRNFDTDPATVSVVPGSPVATKPPPQIDSVCINNKNAQGVAASCKPANGCALSIGGVLDCGQGAQQRFGHPCSTEEGGDSIKIFAVWWGIGRVRGWRNWDASAGQIEAVQQFGHPDVSDGVEGVGIGELAEKRTHCFHNSAAQLQDSHSTEIGTPRLRPEPDNRSVFEGGCSVRLSRRGWLHWACQPGGKSEH